MVALTRWKQEERKELCAIYLLPERIPDPIEGNKKLLKIGFFFFSYIPVALIPFCVSCIWVFWGLTQQFPYITNRSWGHFQISNFLIIRTQLWQQYFCLKYPLTSIVFKKNRFVLKIYLLNDWNDIFGGAYWFLNCYISIFGGLFTSFK